MSKFLTSTFILLLKLIALVFVLFILFVFVITEQFPTKVIFHEKSIYHDIFILQNNQKSLDLRCLSFEQNPKGYQSCIKMNSKQFAHDYSKAMLYAVNYTKNKDDILFLGMGGAIIPTAFRDIYPDAKIDIVDIDPLLPLIAKNYFNFKADKKMIAITQDARVFVKNTPKKYDIIFLDVFNGVDIPNHLTTVEFFTLLKSKLKDGGVIVWNTCSQSEKFRNKQQLTMEKVFGSVYLIQPRVFGYVNTVVMVLNKEGVVQPEINLQNDIISRKVKFYQADVEMSVDKITLQNGEIFTDDKNDASLLFGYSWPIN